VKRVICVDCRKEKEIEEVHILIYKTPVCRDCADDRENMALAKRTKEHFDSIKS
jgi:hypothetical protein